LRGPAGGRRNDEGAGASEFGRRKGDGGIGTRVKHEPESTSLVVARKEKKGMKWGRKAWRQRWTEGTPGDSNFYREKGYTEKKGEGRVQLKREWEGRDQGMAGRNKANRKSDLKYIAVVKASPSLFPVSDGIEIGKAMEKEMRK